MSEETALREAVGAALAELECLEAAIERSLSPERDEFDLVLEHFLRSVAAIRRELGSTAGGGEGR